MWKQILDKLNAVVLANWAHLAWFVMGVVVGVMAF
jgi:hypothetical protein|tara:strand:- start:41782 stop:41886 length:105 start_codon:yes stop_codon:yes gene_type:complete